MPDWSAVPPGVPPEDYQSFIQAQRQQMLADALMRGALTPIQQPETQSVKGLYVQPRVGVLQGVSKIADALLGSRAMNKAVQSQIGLNQALNQSYAPGGQPIPGTGAQLQAAPAGSGTNTDASDQGVQPLVQRNPGQSLEQTAAAAQPQFTPVNPRNPAGLPADVVRNLAMTDPKAYAEMLAGKTPEIVGTLRAAGIDPNSQLGRQLQQNLIAKQQRDLETLRGGNTVYDKATGKPLFTAPDQGVFTQWQNGQPVQSTIPGALTAEQEAAEARTRGAQRQTPIKLGTDENGRDIYGYPVTAPPIGTAPAAGGAGAASPAAAGSVPNATAPGQTASAATVAGQKSGGEASSSYAADLAKNATGATEVRRSLSELRNLANQATPAAMNEGKMRLGSYMIASGMPAETVGKWLGVDVGALQAAQKQTATLAVNTIHSMTSRGTNFDLDTFMRNNPNMNMADPAAFQRVVDYMDNKAQQEVAKNKDFVQWRQTDGRNIPRDEWENAHTSHWLDLQNQRINAGKSNSRPPLTSFVVGQQ